MALRNLSDDQIETANQENIRITEITESKSNTPLGTFWKVLTFIFPGVIQIIFSGTFKADGYDRKAKELVRWTLYGFSFYLGLAFLIFLIDSF
ncbi:hypothetical protein NF867_14470 [Solitalea sp. MAHUQ-68]|uniref:Uncharacterized protein n=1 Tax=Solitalea agri TaxID=2953739 RepID=A0A9X2JDF0_9SPHI|nr:hypothetical protein [Solitalea agri]MCO4294068.1 hypothetical protein [Solitalea agri]